MSMVYEIGFAWASIVAYAFASALSVIGLFFDKEKVRMWAVRGASAGLCVHSVSIVIRWIRIGHGPYIGFYEVASLLAWLSVAMLLWLVWRYRTLSSAGVLVLPIAFLIMGASLLVSKEAEPVTGGLASYWLAIHVLFANLAYGSYVGAFYLSAVYLLREYGHDRRWASVLDKVPPQEEMDGLTYRLVGAGFLFQGVMIASGAIWANESWGRYWGWDPMETWSLIAWAVYALYLHLTLTRGWRGKRAAWVAVVSLPVIVFSLIGVPVVYQSIHGAYLKM